MRIIPTLLGGCLLLVLAPRIAAHFRLLEPASWIQESEELGDPQWSAPCGGTLKDPGKPTGAVTKIQGGAKLHIRIREMAFHPGSRSELPPDPEPMSEPGPNGRQRSVSGAIHYPPSPPVLADGLFMHTAAFDKEQEADVEIPNINCAKCTLQVIEFMAAHGYNPDGGFTYHHCAELQIRANKEKPIDTRFPAENKERWVQEPL
jgi:hypothetical protein